MNKKDYKLSFRVDEKIYNDIISNSTKLKISKSKYINYCIKNKKLIVIDNLDEIIYQLKKIGNNINQLTKSSYIYSKESINYSELVKEISNIWQLLNVLISKKGI